VRTVHVSQLEFGDGADGIQPQAETNRVAGTQVALGATPASSESHTDRPLLMSASPPKQAIAAPAKVKRSAPGLEELLTFADAATVLGISLRQFRRLVDGGKIAFVKVSERSPRIPPSELQRFLAASVVKYSEVKS
jgi:excisionase family DNA binding protein